MRHQSLAESLSQMPPQSVRYRPNLKPYTTSSDRLGRHLTYVLRHDTAVAESASRLKPHLPDAVYPDYSR